MQSKRCLNNCGNYGNESNGGLCNSCFSKQSTKTFQSNDNTILEDNWFEYLAGCKESEFNKRGSQIRKGNEGNLILKNIKTNKEYDCGKYNVLSLGEMSENLDWTPIRPMIPIEIITRDDFESIKFVDVGYLQSTNPGSMFQCASNFNGIEAPNDDVHPDMHNFTTMYTKDRTQGPTASVSGNFLIKNFFICYQLFIFF